MAPRLGDSSYLLRVAGPDEDQWALELWWSIRPAYVSAHLNCHDDSLLFALTLTFSVCIVTGCTFLD